MQLKKAIYLLLLSLKDYKTVSAYYKAKKQIEAGLQKSDCLFMFPHYHVGGAEKVHLRISQIAKDSGLKPFFIFTGNSTTATYKAQFEKAGPIADIGFRFSNNKINGFLKGYLSKKINDSNVRFFFGSNSAFYYELIPALKEIKLIDLVHAYNPPYETANVAFASIFNKLASRVLINTNALENMQAYYKTQMKGLSNKHLKLIYNAPFSTSSEPDSSCHKEYDGIMEVLFVSRNSPEKKPQIAFETAARLCAEYPGQFVFKMIGDFDSFKEKYSLPGIEIISNISDSSGIIPYYKKAHCVISTSQTEGFPLVISEAMFFNAIPVSTNVGGIPGIIKNGENGVLINSQPDEMALVSDFISALVRLKSNPETCKYISYKTFETAKIYFGNEKFIGSYKQLFLN